MARDRMRLDELLVERGLAVSRSQAQRLIMAGSVRVAGARADKAGTAVRSDADVDVEAPARFVSRGGDKLEHALVDLADAIDARGWHVEGAVAVDVGASTGGFTDCLLQRGAAVVHAIDVGYGQLHPRLREDARVNVFERTNARHVACEDLPGPPPDLLVCDASFISLATVLGGIVRCMADGWWGVLLCKPQFEAGPQRVPRGGVIRDPQVREAVVAEVVEALAGIGVAVHERREARPRGPKGNVEYALLVSAAPDGRR